MFNCIIQATLLRHRLLIGLNQVCFQLTSILIAQALLLFLNFTRHALQLEQLLLNLLFVDLGVYL